ncbi:MAG: flagellar rod assembly protein/muramidase FlgJ [gamma proteobacterium symbiont of Ctena orbiculata]|uniref:Peptidoglycan hydrolase FlgJ n=1 Tax=Candidatus Thiodiazotropha taylori TaxID=2792791 RepID=A0A944QTM2_9GAMM|nr:flagellar assembly peptidoglycan hydrolase FlgJ [Candidatus Thiodiazotropha taylori]PUB86609.1 MAG: flagellar assembly peptidoglycan hydrolase FlgJ [gamma proteobacterium symbiont of Ctena orbiculata]MBT2987890.1 flagellar assembly peptidoglycan hydrolase FlgJ [Candidatus Thiodiazotropha taylori]MBT2998934.1 flagellar assembly peptidoglycan hydrolase FlgJ [Candidatus Thiodiazotropha taylori]MBT2999039.1 flagellar assembly peptidoglycan hydrolase FlgJ [Candidatus Thiodiazotropha taylori]
MNAATPALYHDFSGLANLKRQAREDQGATVDQVARQFESLFVQMMVKQMRQASFGGGLFESSQSRFARDMYDQQLAVHLSEKRGLGMLQMLRSQLAVEESEQPPQNTSLESYWLRPSLLARSQATTAAESADEAVASRPSLKIDSPESFVEALWPAADEAAKALGLPTEALLAQAALETGWGGHVMQAADGGSSHNLFGIKADQRWGGDRVKQETLEYQQDVAVRRRDYFRTYASYEESFRDYVAFLKENPRYMNALQNTRDAEEYFKALQDAGYATDPNYAQKIVRVMQGPEMQTALGRFKASPQQSIQSETEAI